MKLTQLIIFLVNLWLVCGLKLPSYLKPCREKDPEINKCALKHGNEAIPHILKGDRRYRIPSMMPFKISSVNVHGGENFKIKMDDIEVWGIDKTKLVDIDINTFRRTIKIVLTVDILNIGGTYDIDARILVLPIRGKGPANITLHKPVMTYVQEWGLKELNGEIYGYTKNSKLAYDIERAEYNFQNLFNGNERLGIETNRLLNENWGVVHSDVSSPVGQAIVSVVDSIIDAIYEVIPYKYLFIHD